MRKTFLSAAAALSCAAALGACSTMGMNDDDAMMNDGMGAGAMASVRVGGAEMFANRNIVENAVNSPIHRTLVAAVKQANLVETLSGPGPFTVFAPTDTAFNAVPASARTSLMMDANRAQLQSVLTYHVVPGRLTAADLMSRVRAGGGTATLTTVQGGTLRVRQNGSRLTVTDATGGTASVTQGDVMQSNGVIHVVDRVLMAG